jgi:pimeloyl-ACP methyl ester carboxylesterase
MHPIEESCAGASRVPGPAFLVLSLLLIAGVARAQSPPSNIQPRHRRSHVLPITDFYDVPKPLPQGKPGDLIRSEEYDDYELPYQLIVKRILYHSRSATGEDVAVSGVVLVPPGNPPSGGWRVIAWAHGFTGIGRQCAPSLMRNVDSGPILAMYVRLGYVVVASDYAGLGTDFRSASVDLPSNATDIINSIPAARAAVPHLASKWLVMGKSEGGLVAMAVDEMESGMDDPGFLGSVSLTGIAQMEDIYQRLATGPSPGRVFPLSFAIKTVSPKFDVEEMLTAKGLPLYEQAAKSCLEVESQPISASEILRPGWDRGTLVQDFFRRDALGLKTAKGPILIVSGGADSMLTPAMTERLVARLCQRNDQVQWYDFPGLDPGDLIGTSVRDPIAWIQGRFAGEPAPTTCH